MLAGTVLVDELVTGVAMLELPLKVGVTEMTEEVDTDNVVLRLELKLVALAEELVVELENELEVGKISVTGRATLELDALPGLEVVEMVDEFEMGYKTLLERVLLLDPVIGLVLMVLKPSELADTPGPIEEEGLVEAEGPVDAEGLVDDARSVDAEVFIDVEGLIDDEELDTAGLKMTVAKMSPGATLRLCTSN